MVPGASLCAGVVGGLTSVMHDPRMWFTGEGEMMKKMDPAIRITRLAPLLSLLAYASGFDTRAGFKIRGRCISRTLGSAIYDRVG